MNAGTNTSKKPNKKDLIYLFYSRFHLTDMCVLPQMFIT